MEYSAMTLARTDELAIPYPSWIALNRKRVMELATSPDAFDELPIEMRLLMVAYARMNTLGHAAFEAPRGHPELSELRMLLGRVDKGTGERVPCSPGIIYKAKKRLAKTGFLASADGGLVCVWVATDHAYKGNGGAAICPFHRTRRSESLRVA